MRTVLFLFLPIFLSAQRDVARSEIEQINRTYTAMTSLQSEVDYVMYATHSSTKPIDTQHATLSRQGDSYLYKLGPVETLTTPTYTVTADYEDKELLLDKVRGNPAGKILGLDLKTTLEACEAVSVSSPAPGQRLIRLDLPVSDIERLDLQFDAMSHKMQKVIFYYREAAEWEAGRDETQARLEIIYRKQEERPVFAKNLFSLERFTRSVNGVFIPGVAFQDFSFYDTTGY